MRSGLWRLDSGGAENRSTLLICLGWTEECSLHFIDYCSNTFTVERRVERACGMCNLRVRSNSESGVEHQPGSSIHGLWFHQTETKTKQHWSNSAGLVHKHLLSSLTTKFFNPTEASTFNSSPTTDDLCLLQNLSFFLWNSEAQHVLLWHQANTDDWTV